jgi:hypothetical protein
MHKRKIALTLSFLVAAAFAPTAIALSAQPGVTEQEAHAIGVDAYIYLYPLVTISAKASGTKFELWYIDAFAGTGYRIINHPARPRSLFGEDRTMGFQIKAMPVGAYSDGYGRPLALAQRFRHSGLRDRRKRRFSSINRHSDSSSPMSRLTFVAAAATRS